MTTLVGINWPWIVVPVWAYDQEVIEAALHAVLFTSVGEMVMNDTYGSQLREIVFENTGPILQALARREIILSVSQNLPFIEIRNIDIEEPEDDNKPITIFVQYKYNEITGVVNEVFLRAAA